MGYEQKFLVVHVFCFDLQFLLAGFTHPAMFSIDESMVVDAFAVVFGAEIAFHTDAILSYLRLQFLGCIAKDHQIDAAICGASFRCVVRRHRPVLAIADGG